jgi:DNA invertase Pin-like site-specific DNA recombinase
MEKKKRKRVKKAGTPEVRAYRKERMVKGAEAIGMSPKKICRLFRYSLSSFYRIKNDLLNPESK